jgi:hypothetical protein
MADVYGEAAAKEAANAAFDAEQKEAATA